MCSLIFFVCVCDGPGIGTGTGNSHLVLVQSLETLTISQQSASQTYSCLHPQQPSSPSSGFEIISYKHLFT